MDRFFSLVQFRSLLLDQWTPGCILYLELGTKLIPLIDKSFQYELCIWVSALPVMQNLLRKKRMLPFFLRDPWVHLCSSPALQLQVSYSLLSVSWSKSSPKDSPITELLNLSLTTKTNF